MLDFDECSADSSPCDKNADCANTDGSHICVCKEGFSGDGSTCIGKTIGGDDHNLFPQHCPDLNLKNIVAVLSRIFSLKVRSSHESAGLALPFFVSSICSSSFIIV